MGWKDKLDKTTNKVEQKTNKLEQKAASANQKNDQLEQKTGLNAKNIAAETASAAATGNMGAYSPQLKNRVRQQTSSKALEVGNAKVDAGLQKLEEKHGATAGQAARDLNQAARSGDLTGFANNQKAAGLDRATAAAENKYAQATDNAANKVEAKYGATAGQAARDLSQAARSGDLTGFASNQAAAGMQRFDDTKARYTDKAQTQIDNTIGRGADKLKKATSKLPSGLANAINGKIDSLSGGLSGALGQKAGDFIGSIGISEEEIASAAETPKALAFAVNLVNKLVINSGNVFTLRQLVDKLISLEKDKGYDAALLASKQINYTEVCDLVQLGDPRNDPNIMPSRFMLLPGCDDESLKAKGNLNEAPWSIAKNSGQPELISVENLRRNLALEGFLTADIQTQPSATRVAPKPPASIAKPSAPEEEQACNKEEATVFDDVLKGAFFDFLKVTIQHK